MKNNDTGSLEVIAGCMFSGKTEELLRRLRRAIIAKKNVKVFKPELDNRFSLNIIHSKNSLKIDAKVIKNISDIRKEVVDLKTNQYCDVVGIDEVQFFDSSIIDLIDELVDNQVQVIVSGLDLDFKAEPFNNMSYLLCKAQSVTKLTAICVVCGSENAIRSQRLIEGIPAKKDSPLIMVGDKQMYEARCLKCYSKAR